MVMLMIRVQYFGTADISVNGVSILQGLSKKGAALLFYICASKKHHLTRESLSMIFWPSYTKDSSLNNLRYTLWKIRKELKIFNLEQVLLSKGKQFIEIDKNMVQSDLDKFNHAITTDQIAQISTYYQGSFLEDFYLYDVPSFSDWVFNERAYYEKKYFDAQLSFAQDNAKDGYIDKATNIISKLITLDPLNEMLYCILINYQYNSNNKVAAINTYRNVKQLLRDELNISPSNELQQLAERIITDERSTSMPCDNSLVKEHRLILHPKNDSSPSQQKTLLRRDYIVSKNTLIIDICDSPGYRVDYEGIFELVNNLEDHGQYSPKQWINEFFPIVSKIRNKPLNADYYLFQQLMKLMSGECSEQHVIRIWNLHWLDEKTIDFISYLHRHQREKELIITGILDPELSTPRLEAFIKAHEESAYFHYQK